MKKKICFVIDTFDFFLTHRLDLCNELSKKYSVSKERIRQIEEKSLNTLKETILLA